MSTITNFLELTKPAATERYDIAVQNANMDAIDAAVKSATERVRDETGASLELQNNMHHICDGATALTVTYANGLHRSTMSVTASEANAITLPAGTICSGVDCSGGVFTAISGKRYTIAVLHDGAAYTAAVSGYVVE